MLEGTLIETLQRVPELAVLVFIVIVFVRHLERRDKVIGECIGENNRILGEVKAVLDRLNGRGD